MSRGEYCVERDPRLEFRPDSSRDFRDKDPRLTEFRPDLRKMHERDPRFEFKPNPRERHEGRVFKPDSSKHHKDSQGSLKKYDFGNFKDFRECSGLGGGTNKHRDSQRPLGGRSSRE